MTCLHHVLQPAVGRPVKASGRAEKTPASLQQWAAHKNDRQKKPLILASAAAVSGSRNEVNAAMAIVPRSSRQMATLGQRQSVRRKRW